MLKTVAGLASLLSFLLAPLPAGANTLLTGAIRDRAGVAVARARVTAFDGSGRIVGHDVAAEDGTFAIDLPASAATIAVECNYCEPVRRTIDATSNPLVEIVQRFSAVTQSGPSTADIRALPYRSAADIASLRPFTTVRAGRISDRGLDAYAATLVDGLPFYSPADGDNYSRLVPAQAIAALSTSSALAAPIYGGYASAGVYDIRLHHPDVSTSRLDAGNGFDFVARTNTPNAAAVYGVANDGGSRREVAAANLDLLVDGGRLSLDGLDMADGTSHASGAGIAYTTDSRRYTTAASVRATQTGDASMLTVDALVRNRGPFALDFGIRATRATSQNFGNALSQADGAIYAAAIRDSGAMTLSADLALDRGSDSASSGSVHAQALIASLANDVRLSANWSTHLGVVSNLRVPTFAETLASAPAEIPGNRSLMFEQSATYTDLRRVRITGVAYTQRTTALSIAHVNGIGIDAGWQIAPQLSLRTWLLHSNQSVMPPLAVGRLSYNGEPSAYVLARQLVWFTYEAGVRVDAIVRGGALEGDLRIPFGGTSALAIGAAAYNGTRVTTIGVTLR